MKQENDICTGIIIRKESSFDNQQRKIMYMLKFLKKKFTTGLMVEKLIVQFNTMQFWPAFTVKFYFWKVPKVTKYGPLFWWYIIGWFKHPIRTPIWEKSFHPTILNCWWKYLTCSIIYLGKYHQLHTLE